MEEKRILLVNIFSKSVLSEMPTKTLVLTLKNSNTCYKLLFLHFVKQKQLLTGDGVLLILLLLLNEWVLTMNAKQVLTKQSNRVPFIGSQTG